MIKEWNEKLQTNYMKKGSMYEGIVNETEGVESFL